MNLRKSEIAEVSSRLPFLMDKTSSEQYMSVGERSSDMAKSGTFAGNLEMMIISFLLKRQMHVFQQKVTGYEMVSKIPNDVFVDNPPIVLLNHQDEHGHADHFDALQYVHHHALSTQSPLSSSVGDILGICRNKCSECDRKILFRDIIDPYSKSMY